MTGTIDVKQYYLSPSNSVKQAKARKYEVSIYSQAIVIPYKIMTM